MIKENFYDYSIEMIENEIGHPMLYSEKILIAEDESRLLDHLANLLTDEGFETIACASYIELESLIDFPVNKYDLIMLDRLLDGKDSAELITKIKLDFPHTKILILSAINTPREKANLLDQGADDYLAKPFESEELIARIRVLLRRSYHSLKLGNTVLNSISRNLNVNNQEIVLTNKEFLLLKTLMQTPGKIFSKFFLYEQVWEIRTDIDTNVVETTINRLRRKLDETAANIKIKNARNIGYWIEE